MVGPHSLEMVMHVAELADVAWGVHEFREKGHEREHTETEKALEQERLENQKLRAAIQVYENALQKELDRQGSVQTLGESLHLSEENSFDLHDQIKKKLESPSFLHKLKGLPPDGDGKLSTTTKATDGVVMSASSEDPNFWLWINDNDMLELGTKEEKDGLESDGYVLVNHEDFVDGIANFLAKYISSMPQAKKMTPKELQDTVLQAFTKTEKKGKVRRLWETGKLLYTATSWGATVFGLYRHPVVLRAASMAVMTTCSLILALLK